MPTPAELTPLAVKILETVQAAGGVWITRLDIAQRIGRPNRLTPRDIQMLNYLVAMGLIEESRRTIGVVQEEYVYKAGAPHESGQ